MSFKEITETSIRLFRGTTNPATDVFTFVKQEPPAGCWVLNGNLRFYVSRKPSILAKFFAKLLLQWKWEDSV